MHIISKILIGLIALFHSYIMIFEMFMWESRGPKVFTSFPEDLFSQPIRDFITACWRLGFYGRFCWLKTKTGNVTSPLSFCSVFL